VRDVLGGVTLFCVALGLVQLTFLLVTGAVEARRARRRAAGQAQDGDVVDAVFALVPCLDEELVIADTVRELLAQDPGVRVVVVDDASDDRTAEAAAEAGGDRVVVHRRRLPDARKGKGPALNAGFARVREAVEAAYLDPERVLVLVMDADGRLSPGAVGRVKALFAEPKVGGAQLGVRIRNRATNTLTMIQDCEFWGIAALGQMGRVRTGTVSLGGNGQFTRLSALLALDGDPWSASLTEDLDLAVSLSMNGWQLTSTPDAWVSQQGLDRLRPLVRQRTRWFQGHMTTANTRIRGLWASNRIANVAVLEVVSYLLIPYLIVLPWSILSQLGIAVTLSEAQTLGAPISGGTLSVKVIALAAWYVISFAPTIVCGLVYARRQEDMSLLRGALFAHVLVLWNYVLFVACWRAVFRMVTGRTSWVKTARLAEVTSAPPAVALEKGAA
jgi:1,2-diacylglycerol 3-beta-glucosyltransferase